VLLRCRWSLEVSPGGVLEVLSQATKATVDEFLVAAAAGGVADVLKPADREQEGKAGLDPSSGCGVHAFEQAL
jgi:hypothetical protein